MKQVPMTKFKQMSAEEIEDGGCFELTKDGEPVAQVIVGTEGEMRTRIEGIASQIDASRGK